MHRQRRRAIGACAGLLAGLADGAEHALTVIEPRKPSPRWALALGSGSIHGLAHLGVLHALARHGLSPDLIVGTSIGAIIGALAAARLPTKSVDSFVMALDWSNTARPAWTLHGLLNNRKLAERVDEAVAQRPIEQLPIRFCAVATDLTDGRAVLLSSGPVGRAVAASSAIPVLFAPVNIDGRDLVDGSLAMPVPVDAARTLGVDFVLAVDIAYRPTDERAGTMGAIAFQAMHILVNRLIDEQIVRADWALRLDVHPLMRIRLDPQELIAAGDHAFEQAWPGLRAKMLAAGIAGVGP